MEIHSEKCIVRQFHWANVTGYTYKPPAHWAVWHTTVIWTVCHWNLGMLHMTRIMDSNLALQELPFGLCAFKLCPKLAVFNRLILCQVWEAVTQGSVPYTTWHLGVILEITLVPISFWHCTINHGHVNIFHFVLTAFISVSVWHTFLLTGIHVHDVCFS